MRGLLIKDILLMKNQMRIFLFYIFLSVGMFLADFNTVFVINYATLIFCMFSISTISYDEFDNGYAFLFTLPVTREQYTAEKYVFGILTGGLAWLVVNIIAVIMNVVRGRADAWEIVVTSLLFLILSFLFLSVMIPVQLKFGQEKGRTALFIIIGVIFAIGFLAVRSAKIFQVDLSAAARRLNTLQLGPVTAILLLCGVAVIIVSYLVSVRIIRKKQF
ncbi:MULTISPECIES: ABC-2 transporter permease [Lacrimispora]|jgi:hypothetical protein|uniref:ABC-2 transporter permease n=1 Tax=Lacrimispora TaxID=2719231 RepID=UPI000BE24EAA|nr:ABC-2 transporter permease [Lacrimispora amygdalina]MDK2965426.1 type transport system permease protein [Lacrimispora sp.]